MRTIEIPDNESFVLGITDEVENEKINYVFADKVYSKLEHIMLGGLNIKFSLSLEGEKLNAPNLKGLGIFDEYSYNIFQSISEGFLHAPSLENVNIYNRNLKQIPNFLKRVRTLKSLIFRNPMFTEIPPEIFEMKNLQNLSFHYCRKIRILPDKIKNLQKLESFNLWEADIEYLSPELFLLPQIQSVNFAYVNYNPTTEVLDNLKKYKNDGKSFSGWNGYIKE